MSDTAELIDRLVTFVQYLNDWAAEIRGREDDFKPILGDYGFSQLKYPIPRAVEDFEVSALHNITRTLLIEKLPNAGLDAQTIVNELTRHGRDLTFKERVHIVTTHIEQQLEDGDEMSYGHLLDSARRLLPGPYGYERVNDKPKVIRQGKTLKLRCYLNGAYGFSSAVHREIDAMNALARLYQVHRHGVNPRVARFTPLSYSLLLTMSNEGTIWGHWIGCGYFDVKPHKNDNLYVRCKTEEDAKLLENLLLTVPNADPYLYVKSRRQHTRTLEAA